MKSYILFFSALACIVSSNPVFAGGIFLNCSNADGSFMVSESGQRVDVYGEAKESSIKLQDVYAPVKSGTEVKILLGRKMKILRTQKISNSCREFEETTFSERLRFQDLKSGNIIAADDFICKKTVSQIRNPEECKE